MLLSLFFYFITVWIFYFNQYSALSLGQRETKMTRYAEIIGQTDVISRVLCYHNKGDVHVLNNEIAHLVCKVDYEFEFCPPSATTTTTPPHHRLRV